MNRKIIVGASAAVLVAAALVWPVAGPGGRSLAPAMAADPATGVAIAAAQRPAGNRAVDALFADPAALGETRAVVVLRDGEVIAERYGPGFGPDSKLISWSMAKSITAVLIGFLVADGQLALDDPAPVPAWQRPGDPRGAITLRHLLHMSSGLDHVENGDPVWAADTVEMLFGAAAADMAGFAEAKPPVAQPGEQFNYSSATSIILADILARTLTPSDRPVARREAVRAFIAGRLTEPLGMTSLTPEFDARGTMIGGSIVHATARDYARFGEFLRQRGVVDGARLLPEGWVDFMLAPSPRDGGYGGHIWLNRPRPAGSDAALWPQRGPNDMFAALGHQGQYIIVSPSQRVTVVRLGVTNDPQFPALRQRLADLLATL